MVQQITLVLFEDVKMEQFIQLKVIPMTNAVKEPIPLEVVLSTDTDFWHIKKDGCSTSSHPALVKLSFRYSIHISLMCVVFKSKKYSTVISRQKR